MAEATETTMDDERSIYEIGYHLVPTLGQEGVPAEVTALKAIIEKHGGAFLMEEYPELMELAYTMEKVHTGRRDKFDTAFFGWVKFSMEPDHILRVKEELDASPHILRYLLITTVAEDTRAPKRVLQKPEAGGAPAKSSSPAAAPREEKPAEASTEEIDKSIAELVSQE